MDGGQLVRGALLSWKCMALSLEWASGHEEVSGYEPRVSKSTCSVATGRDRQRSSVAAIQSVTPLSAKESKV